MNQTTKPTKEQVREVMEQHRKERALPTPDEYRRQLGWNLIQGAALAGARDRRRDDR